MHPDAAHNVEATARLRALVDGLSAGDLRRSLGGGWTVAMALGHLAFWDGRQAAELRWIVAGGALEPEGDSDATNEALGPLLRALVPEECGEIALVAAADVDAVAADLPDSLVARLLAGEEAYLMRRWAHREEHIEQVMRALP